MNNKLLKVFTKRPYIVKLGRASFGIYIALMIWGKSKKRKKIAVSNNVCHDVIFAIIKAGFEPFFCDISCETGNVLISELIRAKENGVSGIINIHAYGNPIDSNKVRQIFPKNDFLFIDDAAQSIGAKYGNTFTGDTGDIGIFSFGKSKQIKSEGGIIACNELSLFKEINLFLKQYFYQSKIKDNRNITKFTKKFYLSLEEFKKKHNRNVFQNLLMNYDPNYTLWNDRNDDFIEKKISRLDEIINDRISKLYLWNKVLSDLPIKSISLDISENIISNPWRACFFSQDRSINIFTFANKLRKFGINISHWYPPGNWYLNVNDCKLEFSEIFFKNSFQLWIDESISLTSIKKQGKIINECF